MAKIQIQRQTAQNECGICCICMVASFYGYVQPLSYYRDEFNVGRDGINIYSLVQILKNVKLESVVYNLKSLTKFELSQNPYILFMRKNHYIVIKKTKTGVNVYDPSKGKFRSTLEKLNEDFGGYLIEIKKQKDFVENKVHVNDLRYIIPVLKTEKRAMIILAFLSIISYSVSLYIPMILQNIINEYSDFYMGTIGYKSIIQLSSVLIIYYFLSHIRNEWLVNVQKKMYYLITEKTIIHLFKLKYSFYDNRSQGDILFRINLLSQIQAGVSTGFLKVILALTFIIMLFALFVLQYKDIILIILFLAVIIAVFVIYINKIMSLLRQEELRSREKTEAMVTEIVSNMYQIKCINLSKYFMKEYDDLFEKFLDKYGIFQKKSNKLNLILNLLFTYFPIYFLALLITLPYFKKYNFGELFALYSLLGMFFSQCLSLVSEIINIYILKSNIFYYNDMIDEPEEKDKGDIDIKEFNSLIVNNINFRYSDFSDYVIKEIRFNISKGEKVAIVGLSGSGKTTLIKLIAGLYDPTEGEIFLNGVPLSSVKSESCNKLISVVPQTPVFFNKSVFENIAMDKKLTEEEVKDALNMVNLLDDIEKMPMKLNTIISGQGGNISGGQIQRLAIARAIVSKPELIILDEATSSLDSWNERNIYNNLKTMEIAQLVISHRLSSIIDADRIYCLKEGRIVEVGNHEQLYNKKGYYYQLFKSLE